MEQQNATTAAARSSVRSRRSSNALWFSASLLMMMLSQLQHPITAFSTTTTTTTSHRATTPLQQQTASSSRLLMVATPTERENDCCEAAEEEDNTEWLSDQEFQLQVGRALDALRKDYPDILTTNPDFAIYGENIEVVDPSGVKVHGLKAYKNTFMVLHALVKFIYCPALSNLTFRMCFDKARQSIRIHWNAVVVPREIFGSGEQHFDGISVYELDRSTGAIVQHRIEQLLRNSMPVRPKEGLFKALQKEHMVTVPSFSKDNAMVRFQSWPGTGRQQEPSSLFAMEASPDNNEYPEDHIDWEALERKNKSRKKFGLDPISPEEFLNIEAAVQELDSQQRQRAAASSSSTETTAKDKRNNNNWMDKILGQAASIDSCESNFDCERPEVCCDFGFKQMCCSSGSLVGLMQQREPKRELVPVPVTVNIPPQQQQW